MFFEDAQIGCANSGIRFTVIVKPDIAKTLRRSLVKQKVITDRLISLANLWELAGFEKIQPYIGRKGDELDLLLGGMGALAALLWLQAGHFHSLVTACRCAAGLLLLAALAPAI